MYNKSLKMKRVILNILLVAMSAIMMVGCGKSGKSATGDDRSLPDATGSPFELLAIVPQDVWESPVGDSLASVFAEPVKFINQYEPVFDMMRILPENFKDFLRKHRNIITVRIDPTYTEPTADAVYDRNARPQLFVSLYGPDKESLAQYIADNREELIALFENTERERMVSAATKFRELNLIKMIKDMFGMDMNVPRGYVYRGALKSGDMIVMSYEYPVATQGFAVYSYPYTGSSDFQKENIIAMRNKYMANIPGPSEGSYMTTSTVFEPEVFYRKIGDRAWAETRGFWETENDYMGGPFVSFSTLDADRGRVVVIDGYVYSPRDEKRNMLRNLENLVYSVDFPGDNIVVEAECKKE